MTRKNLIEYECETESELEESELNVVAVSVESTSSNFLDMNKIMNLMMNRNTIKC